jgi:hypothetical protein
MGKLWMVAVLVQGVSINAFDDIIQAEEAIACNQTAM